MKPAYQASHLTPASGPRCKPIRGRLVRVGYSQQRQPAWRGKAAQAQLRRFLAAGSRRKLRYARLLTEAAELDRMPRPLDAVLADA